MSFLTSVEKTGKAIEGIVESNRVLALGYVTTVLNGNTGKWILVENEIGGVGVVSKSFFKKYIT